MSDIFIIKNIGEMHRIMQQDKPRHPLITIIDFSQIKGVIPQEFMKFTTGFYSVMLKQQCHGELKYGRNYYDFQDGTLVFTAPEQVITIDKVERPEDVENRKGWGLFFHPDLIRSTSLVERIDEYSFFSYDSNEALHVSDKEKQILADILNHIDMELSNNIDEHSQSVIVTHIELILNYCNRFYHRQFLTRTTTNKDVLSEFTRLLARYFKSEMQVENGLPTVKHCAEKLNLSPGYLSDMLKKETGKNAQDHIHYHILELAKTKLLSSKDTISEIAYTLGFEYPQYFSKMFKNKIGMSPAEYRGKN